jgi:ubiquinone/menaquinone biosynthesis C-methylase UbiE
MITGVLDSGTRQLNGWIVDQLRLQPYQHVLEIGFGTGRLLEEAAGVLRIGFLAGVESSAALYQQAYRRNRRFIARQLVQLHLGELADLPYPPHYFHTIYSHAAMPSGKDRMVELLRLTRLLRSEGRLVLVSRLAPDRRPMVQRPQNVNDEPMAERLRQDYIAAGLHRIHLEHRETSFGAAIAAIGYTA